MPKMNAADIERYRSTTLIEDLGIAIEEAGEGVAVGTLSIGPRHLAPNGFLHAASIVALADSCCGFGTMADLPDGAEAFTTIELKSNHVGTARDGTVMCRATARHQGRTTQIWDAEVFKIETP